VPLIKILTHLYVLHQNGLILEELKVFETMPEAQS